MKSTKFLQILENLSSREMKQFRLYLRSPYLNKRKELARFYEVLLEELRHADSQPLDKEALLRQVFPEREYSSSKFHRMMFGLYQLATEFLAMEEMQEDPLLRFKWKLKALDKKNLKYLLKDERKIVRQNLDSFPYRGLTYYRQTIDLYHDLALYPTEMGYPTADDSIYELMGILDDYFLMAKLWYGCELYTRKQIFNVKTDRQLLDEISQLVDKKLPENNPLFLLYSRLLQCQIQEEFSTDVFLQLIEDYKIYNNYLSHKEQQRIFRHFVTLGYRQMNKSGGKVYTKIIFDLYRYGHDHQLLAHKGNMSDISFSNIVVAGCLLKKFDWVEKFIPAMQSSLSEKSRENTVTLCWAYCYFHQGKHRQTIDTLQDVRFINHSYTLRARTLLVRSQYEMYLRDSTYYFTLRSSLDSFIRMLYRYQNRKISPEKATAYLHLIKVISRMVEDHLKDKLTARHRSRIDRIIDDSQPMVALPWIQEKVKNLYQSVEIAEEV